MAYEKNIYEMFKKLNGVSAYQGSGIGLAICKKIVELHEGFIKAESKSNEGATFKVTLPLSLNME